MARNLPELIFFISIVASWNCLEPGPFDYLVSTCCGLHIVFTSSNAFFSLAASSDEFTMRSILILSVATLSHPLSFAYPYSSAIHKSSRGASQYAPGPCDVYFV